MRIAKPKQRPASVVGLCFEAGRLHACVAGRTKGVLVPGKPVSAGLTLGLAHPDALAAGREVRAQLTAMGITERQCVVALPPAWVMSLTTLVPSGLTSADLESLLQIEAEKGLPCDLTQLELARVEAGSEAGRFVTQFAVRKQHLDQLTAVLRAAKLAPVRYTLGLAALPGVIAPAGQGRITVAAGSDGTTLALAGGGGLVMLRALDPGATAATTAREVRIAVEQMPPGLRPELHGLVLCGGTILVDPLAAALADWARVAGLALTCELSEGDALAGRQAAQVAGAWLEGASGGLEFLPPVPSRWAQLVARYNSKRLSTVAYSVGGVAALALLVFGWQEISRWTLESRWQRMASQVTTLQTVQARLRDYHPWNDMTFQQLRILRRVTGCFPDTGAVTAKTVQIHGPTGVSITGTARDNPSLLRMLEQLRRAPEIRDLKIEQIRGNAPEQFTCSFRWNELSRP